MKQLIQEHKELFKIGFSFVILFISILVLMSSSSTEKQIRFAVIGFIITLPLFVYSILKMRRIGKRKLLTFVVSIGAILVMILILQNIGGIRDELNNITKPHFTSTDIYYGININSSIVYKNKTYRANDTLKENQIDKAIKLVENASGNHIDFHRVEPNSSKKINLGILGRNAYNDDCDNVMAWERELNHTTNGWGEIKSYDPEKREIYYSEVILCAYFEYNYTSDEYYETWKDGGSYPDTEVHEILHALGFDHKNETCHIMNPYTQVNNCENIKINKDISQCLKHIYSNGKKGSCFLVNFMI